MKREDLINNLEKLDGLLRTGEVQEFFKTQQQNYKDLFSKYRQENYVLKETLVTQSMEEINNTLIKLEHDFNDGIKKLEREINNLDDAIAIIDILEKVLNVAYKLAILIT